MANSEELLKEVRQDVKAISLEVTNIKIDVALIKEKMQAGIENKKTKATVFIALVGFLGGLCGTILTIVFR